MADLKQLTDGFWQLFESNQLDEAAKQMDPDCQFKMPGMELRGRDALKQMLAGYRAAFPDMKHTVKSFVESGDIIAIELEIQGTHTGPMQMPQGTIAATGKKLVWESCDYIRVKNGKIISWHAYYDSLPFLTALGVIPSQS